MKIGWIKYTGNLEIGSHLLYTSGTTSIRTNLFESLLRNGTKLILYSPVGRDTEKFLDTKDGREKFGKLKIKLTDKVDKDVDFLIIENGTDNTNFSWNIGSENVPSVAYVNRLISNFEGRCFYMQTDPALPFPFVPEYYSLKYLDNFIQNGSFKSLLKDKSFTVLSSVSDIDNFHKYNNKTRTCYTKLLELGLINFERFEMHYTCFDVEEKFKIKKKHENGIVYIGGQRTRTKKIEEFFDKPAKLGTPVQVYGRWKENNFTKYPEVKWEGILGRGLVHETYNNSFGSIVIGDPVYEKTGFVSGRFFEIIASKSLPLLDVKMLETTVSDLLDKDLIKALLVKNGKDVHKKYNNLKHSNERKDLIKECLKQTKKYNSDTSSENLIKILNSNKQQINKGKKFKKSINKFFTDVFEKRSEENNFSKSFYDTVLKKLYTKDGKTDYGNNELFSANFKKYEGNIFDFSPYKRCRNCGSKNPTTLVCEDCKNDIGDFEKRHNKNLKKSTKKIKIKLNGKK